MIKISKIPTILGILILLAGVIAGVYFLNRAQIFNAGASPTVTPKDIRMSNITDTSATISWITADQTSDFVFWGTSQGSLGKVGNESTSDQKYFTHSITLTGLSPSTTYFYKINSNGGNFDNNGIPWQFTTGPAITEGQNSITVSGSVITSSGAPSKRAIVYITIDGYVLSTLTSDGGNFVLQLGSARTSDLTAFAQIDPSQTTLSISVEGESGNTATAQVYPQSANPVPPLILGQSQDFRSLPPNQTGQNPNASLNLPQGSSQESKFNVSTSSATPTSTSVILESIQQGETITTNQPQFFGKGPGREKITITIHSENPISESLMIPQSGSWSWSVPTPLSAGSHTITISWIDASGITRSLTRDFVVQAGEIPAFTASQSSQIQTPTPAPTTAPTPTPTTAAIAAALPTIAPTSTPVEISPTPIASPASLPVTGDLTPTIFLSIMGLIIIVFSFIVWKSAENQNA